MGSGAPFEGAIAKGAAWLRSAVARAGAAQRRRQASREAQGRRGRALTRSWAEAELSARLAVHAGVRLDDYLRARLARYAVELPVPLQSLGVDVSIEAGEAVISARPSRGASPPRAEAAPVLRTSEREVQEARAELAALSERVSAARTRLDVLSRGVAEDLAAGKLPGAPGAVDASPEQCGRPPVPRAAHHSVWRALAVAMLGAAAYRMAGPALAVAGLSIDDLAGAASRAPFATAAGILLGLGGAVSAFAYLGAAVDRGHELLGAVTASQRPAVLASAGALSVLLSGAVVLGSVYPGALAGPLFLLCVPLAAVLLFRRAAVLCAVRERALSAALEWDRVRAREAAERARRAEAIAQAEVMLTSALRDRAEAERHLQAIERRSADDLRQADLAASDRGRLLDRLAEGLAAALELDRYSYLRRATSLTSAEGSVHPLRSRPAAVDPGVGSRLEAAG